MKYILQIYLI